MPTNLYFNNFASSGEQNLYEDLIIESIKIYGEDVLYVPRVITNYDKLMGADDQSEYNNAYEIEMYIESIDGFTGDGNFMSKFGLEIRDQITLSVARRSFFKEVASQTNQLRPNEGDIIYFPLNNKCFQIRYVDKLEMFYQFGALQTWKLTCELFEYSNEVFNTGIAAIDIIQISQSTNILTDSILEEHGNMITDENSNYLIQEDYSIIGSTEVNTFLESPDGFVLLDENGESILISDEMMPNIKNDPDNNTLLNDSNNFIDSTALNIFGWI